MDKGVFRCQVFRCQVLRRKARAFQKFYFFIPSPLPPAAALSEDEGGGWGGEGKQAKVRILKSPARPWNEAIRRAKQKHARPDGDERVTVRGATPLGAWCARSQPGNGGKPASPTARGKRGSGRGSQAHSALLLRLGFQPRPNSLDAPTAPTHPVHSRSRVWQGECTTPGKRVSSGAKCWQKLP